METAEVKRINEMIEKREEQGPMGTRRRLLATSVRLSRNMAPWLHEMADDCIEKLGVKIPIELYVYASPSYNAACVKPEEGLRVQNCDSSSATNSDTISTVTTTSRLATC